jgi:hypothetical protein
LRWDFFTGAGSASKANRRFSSGTMRKNSPPSSWVCVLSYRITKIKSADQVALEAGNSPSIIFKHYRELTTEQQADEWFSILPKAGQWDNTFTYDTKTRTVTLPKSPDE